MRPDPGQIGRVRRTQRHLSACILAALATVLGRRAPRLTAVIPETEAVLSLSKGGIHLLEHRRARPELVSAHVRSVAILLRRALLNNGSRLAFGGGTTAATLRRKFSAHSIHLPFHPSNNPSAARGQEEAMGRLERNRRVERERAVLERIVALLLALAALADRAAGLPFLKRLDLLAMLGRGEAEARTLIVAMASGAPAEAAAAPTLHDDARLLAARFRMLALALNGLLAQVRGEPPRRETLIPAGSPERRSRPPRAWRTFPAPPAPDTS